MGNLKAKENCTLLPETTILGSLDLTKRKEEEFIIGQERKAMCIKASSKLENGMVEVLFGGQMEVGMKVNLETAYKADREFFIGKVDTASMKATGTMVCLMVKEHNTFRMGSVMKVHSKKISFMEKASFTKMIRSFTEYGKTMSYQ